MSDTKMHPITKLIVDEIRRGEAMIDKLGGRNDPAVCAEFRYLSVTLGRRAGHTTAAKELAELLPHPLVVVPAGVIMNMMYRDMSRLGPPYINVGADRLARAEVLRGIQWDEANLIIDRCGLPLQGREKIPDVMDRLYEYGAQVVRVIELQRPVEEP